MLFELCTLMTGYYCTVPRQGYLAASPRGLLYLDLEDDWVLRLQEEMARCWTSVHLSIVYSFVSWTH